MPFRKKQRDYPPLNSINPITNVFFRKCRRPILCVCHMDMASEYHYLLS